MSSCRKCGCLCDPSDLLGGVCDDCMEAERQLEIRQEWNRMMIARNVIEQADGQLAMSATHN